MKEPLFWMEKDIHSFLQKLASLLESLISPIILFFLAIKNIGRMLLP